MTKKTGLWIGIGAVVVVAAVVVLLIVLLGGTKLPGSPEDFGKLLKEGKNYTMSIVNGNNTTTYKVNGDKIHIVTKEGSTETEIYFEKSGDNYKTYFKVGNDWKYKTLTSAEFGEETGYYEDDMANLFKSENYTKADNVYTYSGTTKKVGDKSFTGATITVNKEDTTLKIVYSTTETETIKITDAGSTAVTIPSNATEQTTT